MNSVYKMHVYKVWEVASRKAGAQEDRRIRLPVTDSLSREEQ